MPIRRDAYPPDWEAISRRIRLDRAGGRCECTRQCGRATPAHLGEDGRCVRRNGDLTPAGRPVVLTTAHLNHDPADTRDEVLAALCQACHLALDGHQHAQTRARTRAAAIAAAGQGALLDPEETTTR